MSRTLVFTLIVVLLAATTAFAQDAAPDGLADTNWVLTELNGDAPAYDATLVYLDGAFAGSTGCNTYNFPVTFDGDSLTVTPGILTRMACPLPDQAEQETAFVDAMSAAAAYTLDMAQFTIQDADGNTVLVFEPAIDILTDAVWVLTSLNDDPISPNAGITATFDDEGLSGSAGCNRYIAAYTRDEDTLTVGPPAATRRLCQPEAVMEREADYLAALETVARYEVSGTELTLFDGDDNAVLMFGAQVNPFFSGTEWTLSELDGEAVLEDAPITLSFDDETLGGSAGCNNYFSGYAMVGGSVALELTGSTMAMCPDDIMTQESAYFAALAEVVAWEATDTELMLLGNDGAVKLRFTLVQPE